MRILLVSTIVFVCCLLGCTPRDASPPSLQPSLVASLQPSLVASLQPSLVAEKIKNEHGYFRSRWLESYSGYLCQRLSNPLREIRECSVTFIRGEKPYALSPGGGQILISHKMISHLSNEAELAFVIAHELSHDALNHFKEESWQNDQNFSTDLELEADQLALGVIAQAGYDPRAAVALLSRLGWSYHATYHSAYSHPSLPERSQRAAEALRESGWRPPGTVNRREFALLKRALAGAKPSAQ